MFEIICQNCYYFQRRRFRFRYNLLETKYILYVHLYKPKLHILREYSGEINLSISPLFETISIRLWLIRQQYNISEGTTNNIKEEFEISSYTFSQTNIQT